MRVLVEGRIATGSYTNKDGQKVYTTEVTVENQEFADGKSGDDSVKPAGNRPAQKSNDGFMNIPDGTEDEGLPFN